MGLSVSLSNALSGMGVTENGLNVLSRNVSNAGTPGYHRQSLNVVDNTNNSSSFATVAGVDRAFSESLQRQYNSGVSSASEADIMRTFLERLESFLGLPGEVGSLDTQYANFENALRSLTTSPDNYATRAEVLTQAQGLVQTLNNLSTQAQVLRRETEAQLADQVTNLNSHLTNLENVSNQLSDQALDDSSRSALADERDRLVASIAEIIDVRVDYRADGTVGLMTQSGLGLFDVRASTFEFVGGGNLSANSLFDVDSAESGVGTLTMTGPSGLEIDLVEQNVIRSGALGALLDLRDDVLPQFQAQLDSIAAGLADALSAVETAGSAATNGAATGFEIDLADVQKGNSFSFSYIESGSPEEVRVIRIDDASKLPLDYVDENGVRTLGIDFSSGIGSVATDLQAFVGAGLVVDNPSGTTLRIVDDGVAATTDVTALSMRTTATSNQDGGVSANLFVDLGDQAFTGSLDGDPQQRGFASRITVSSAFLNDNSLLVQYAAGGPMGDAARAEHMVSQLETLTSETNKRFLDESGDFVISGNVSSLIAQTLNFQGNAVVRAQSSSETTTQTLEAIELRAENEYGVNVDEEMARLLELQNAYAANARVVSIVQELLDTLMRI